MWPAGAQAVKTAAITNFGAGQTVNIDTGANLETATIATVGGGSNSTLALASAAGDTNLKVAAVTGIVAGQTLFIDAGANLENAVVASIGNGGNTTLSAAAAAGATNIKIASTSGLTPNGTITIDAGTPDAETVQMYQVGSTGANGNGINLYAPLTRAHPAGAKIVGTGVTFTAPLLKDHAAGVPVTGLGLIFAAPLSNSHIGAAAVATLSAAGTSTLPVVSVADFAPGQSVTIDTGANVETATIASVGTAGPTGTGITLASPLTISHTGAAAVRFATSSAIGDSVIKVAHIVGFYAGDTIAIDTSANQEVRTILSVGTPTFLGTGITLSAPLTIAHNPGVTVTDTRVLPSTAVLDTDYTVASNTVTFPNGSPSGTVLTVPVTTLPNPDPSVALTINTTIACTTGCTGPTPSLSYNNDPSTIVINAHGYPYLDKNLPIATRVADLLSRMSLFEKVGQMDESLVSNTSNGTTTNAASWNNMRAWATGSVLSGGDNVPTPNGPSGWAAWIDALQSRALSTRLQIPYIYGIDEIHGSSHMIGTTMFPHNVGIGATRDPDLAYQQGVITAAETRTTGPQLAFAPTICVDRDIRWGRTYECFGEDPTLVSTMETIIDGIQGTNPLDKSGMHMLTSAKHFAGDGGTQFGMNTNIDVMSFADYARTQLAQYIPAVQVHHTGTIMPSYNSVQLDGALTSTLMSADGDLMTGWLKDTTGFDGFLISDYNAIDSIPVPSPNPLPAGLNVNYAYQTMVSFNAGMDMVMAASNGTSGSGFKTFVNYLTELVRQGYVPMSRIDDAVSRILTQKFELGLFEQPFTDRSHWSEIRSPESVAVARTATAKSQVLLKNADNVLPLSKSARVYLAGSNADNLSSQLGGWSISWQAIPGGDIAAEAPYVTTIREALEGVVGAANVTYSPTVPTPPAAGTYDVGIVVVGEVAYAEGSGDVPSSKTDAPTAADATAIANVCGVMPCIILTMAGRPFMLTDAQFNMAKGVVATWIGTSEGEGVTDVLFGDVPFTGRLPMTWPTTIAQEPINVGDPTYDPRFPFGWGLRTGTDFSTRASLTDARAALATISGDAHVTAAIADIDAILAAPLWSAGGAPLDAVQIDAGLQLAANELALTDAASFKQQDGVVSAARDIAQSAVVAAGGPNAVSSPLIGDADVALLEGHPDVAVQKLTQVAGLTTTTLVADNNPTAYGHAVTFTATVSTADAPLTGIPTGAVQFSLDGAPVGSPVALDAAGVATWTTSSLPLGTHSVSVDYPGDGFFAASSAGPIDQVVKKRLGHRHRGDERRQPVHPGPPGDLHRHRDAREPEFRHHPGGLRAVQGRRRGRGCPDRARRGRPGDHDHE